jgi:hypothetical protein
MGITNFLVQKYGAAMALDAIKASYPPALVFLDALGLGSLPAAIAELIEAHKKFLASEAKSSPAGNGAAVDWDGYSQRFLTESPADKVLLDLFRDLGIAEVAGIDVDQLFEELVKSR